MANNGPFNSYAPPGVYANTRAQNQLSGPPSGLQIPIFMGTGKETLSQEDFELVRGSSSTVDQLINEEDVSGRFIIDETNPDNPTLGSVDGQSAKFQVRNTPIVIGDGQGLVTNRPQDVDVTVDGVPVVVAAVDGDDGIVTLQVPPPQGSEVRVTYSFNRTDTLREDDVSEQVSDDSAVLKASEAGPYTVVADDNDTLTLSVNGVESTIVLEDGTNLTASDVAIDINTNQIDGLTASADLNNQGQSRLQLSADGSLEIVSGTALSLFGFEAGQSTDRNRSFYTYRGPIVDGSNGGITTTNVNDVTVTVNGETVVPESVDGANNLVVLSEAPVVGSTVLIEYYHNTFQDTFDFLLNRGIVSVDRVGNAPGRNDYIQGLDYIIRDDRILWGSAVTVEEGLFTASGSNEPFDDTEVSTSLVDAKVYLEEVDRLLDRSVSPPQESNKTVVLGNVPTDGSGRDNPTSDVNLVQIYHGTDVQSALAQGEVEVVRVNPDTRQVTVEEPIPFGHKIYATYWYSRLADDTYTLTKTQSGRITVSSELRGDNLFNVRFGTSSATDTIQWPSGVESQPGAFVEGADGVSETVTVTFSTVDALAASLTNTEEDPYSIFANASDTFSLSVSDGTRAITDDAVSVDLNQAAFAVLVSDRLDAGATYTITAANDTFDFQIDGNNYSADLTIAGGTTLADMAEVIWRAVENETEINGTTTENFDLDQGAAGVAYDVTINGTNVANTYTGGASVDAATAAANIASDIETASGTLTAGDITDPANDFNVIANSDGTISIVASESLSVNDGGGGAGADLEDVFGWDGGSVPNDDSIATYTEATTLENTKVARTWTGSEGDYLLLRSRTTPSVPSDESSVRVLSGDANDTLGFDAFATAEGTTSAVNKGATLLSDAISGAMVSNLEAQELDFVVLIDGTEYTVDGSNFDGIASVGDIQTQIDNVIGSGGSNVASVTVEDTDKIRITSLDTTSTSAVEVGDGDANQYVGFEEGDVAGQRLVEASELVAVLNNDTAGWADNSAGSVDLQPLTSTGEFLYTVYAQLVAESGAGEFLNITSFGTGQDTTITLTDSADTVFNDTGIGFEAGDSAVGTDGVDGFTVSSSATSGSAGTGVVGQTYVDDETGLTFTILEAEDGDYADGESFTLISEDSQLVGSSLVNRSIPGVEMIVSSLSNVAVNDTAIVETFDKSGDEPDIGDFYYITYDYTKQDFSSRLFTRFREVQENYGQLSPENPLSLAAYLALLNGASIVAAKQIQKAPGSQQANSSDYIAALEDLESPIQPGIDPDLIVPLSTDPEVFAATVKHCEIQSSPRFRNERRAIFGVASGTQPNDAAQLAQNLNSERAILLYPDSALLSLTNALGEEQTFIVDGSFMAAALAGVIVSPANDVATPLTRRRIVGFDRLNRSLNEIEKNTLATAGVTVLQDRQPFLEVRQGLTTNVATRLTSVPSIIAIKDFVQQQARATLDRFIGVKFLSTETQNVELALTGLLNSLVENQIITAFTGVSAEPDPNDPTLLRVSAYYSPVFPLLYIQINFTISSSLGQ